VVVKIKKHGIVESTEDIFTVVKEFASSNKKLLFRGQNTDKSLLPKIARYEIQFGIEMLEAIERQMLDRFKKESIPFLQPYVPKTGWDWLSVAQHQGLPTRLLDWSGNPLAALWFAVSDKPPLASEHGVLWVLEVLLDDLKSPSIATDIFALRRTYIFQPFHVDRRIAAQSGWFSVHKYAEKNEKFIPLEKNKNFKSRLKKYVIPAGSFEIIRKELRLLGITQCTMFPDLPGLCADISSDLLDKLPPIDSI